MQPAFLLTDWTCLLSAVVASPCDSGGKGNKQTSHLLSWNCTSQGGQSRPCGRKLGFDDTSDLRTRFIEQSTYYRLSVSTPKVARIEFKEGQ